MGKSKEKLKKEICLSMKVETGWEARACCVGALFWLIRAELLKMAFYLCFFLSHQCQGNPPPSHHLLLVPDS